MNDKTSKIIKSMENNPNAINDLAKACALLTSTIKTERETGKKMVREWKNNTTYFCRLCGNEKNKDWLDDGETCPKCKLVQ